MVVAGNRQNGRLTAYQSNGGHKYEATHVTPDGRRHHTRFVASNGQAARKQWEAWCRSLDEKCKPKPMHRNGGKLNKKDRPMHPDANDATVTVAREAGPFRETTSIHGDTAYLLVATEPELKPYGLYLSEETALEDLEHMEEILSFVGIEDALSLLEVPWKG